MLLILCASMAACVPVSTSPAPGESTRAPAQVGLEPTATRVMAATATAFPIMLTSEARPTRAPESTVTPIPTPTPRVSRPMTLTIVYDNIPFDPRLKTDWGFACLIETGAATVLFDTGGDGPTLLGNLAALGIDPRRIEAVVLSHDHTDHTGGLDALLAANQGITLYAPRSFSAAWKTRVGQRARLVQVSEPVTLTERLRTTGELGSAIIEQALIVETDKRVIVITGCAHPGIVEMVKRAKAYGDVDLVMGGFHLGDKSAREIEAVIAELKRLGVKRVAPSHCTGEAAIQRFRAAWGAEFIQAGAGAILTIIQ